MRFLAGFLDSSLSCGHGGIGLICRMSRPTVVDAMFHGGSGNAILGTTPGNALLAFGIEPALLRLTQASKSAERANGVMLHME